tara:strand:- start:816 stop:1115 length:300 start_codon:yes stop_codon:yes gene_type:complete
MFELVFTHKCCATGIDLENVVCSLASAGVLLANGRLNCFGMSWSAEDSNLVDSGVPDPQFRRSQASTLRKEAARMELFKLRYKLMAKDQDGARHSQSNP